jgi:hypothetical protein
MVTLEHNPPGYDHKKLGMFSLFSACPFAIVMNHTAQNIFIFPHHHFRTIAD